MTGGRREFQSRSVRNLSIGAGSLCWSGDRGHAPGAAPANGMQDRVPNRWRNHIVRRRCSPHRATSPTEIGVDFPARLGFSCRVFAARSSPPLSPPCRLLDRRAAFRQATPVYPPEQRPFLTGSKPLQDHNPSIIIPYRPYAYLASTPKRSPRAFSKCAPMISTAASTSRLHSAV